MPILLWHARRISGKFTGVEICSVVLRQQRKPYHPALVQLFPWHHGMHSFWETKQRDAAVVSFTPASVFVYGDHQFANLSVPFQTPCHLTHNHPAFQVPQIHYQIFAVGFKLGFSSGIRELIDA